MQLTSEIVSPHDAGISKAISENQTVWGVTDKQYPQLIHDPTQEIMEAYCKKIKEWSFLKGKKDLPIVFTPMHGVGKEWVKRAFESFGLPPYIPVPLQMEANPDFPTVPFPNPEEGKGALVSHIHLKRKKLAMEAADQNGARLIIANDPDSDRLAIAEKQKEYCFASLIEVINGKSSLEMRLESY